MSAEQRLKPLVTLADVKLEPAREDRAARLAFTFSLKGEGGQALICMTVPCQDGETLASLGEAAWISLESFLSAAQVAVHFTADTHAPA
ncbi:hypothetical protein ACTL6U_02015 [Rhodovibrionaceae bacterium A322]